MSDNENFVIVGGDGNLSNLEKEIILNSSDHYYCYQHQDKLHRWASINHLLDIHNISHLSSDYMPETNTYVNDFIDKERFVAAGAGLQIIFGIGAMGGPFLCSVFMNFYGVNGFFIFLAIFHTLVGIFGLYRITKRNYEDNPESTFTPLPRNITPLGIELDPTTAADLSNTDKK